KKMNSKSRYLSLMKLITGIFLFFISITLLTFLLYPRISITESPEPNPSPEKFPEKKTLLDTCTFVLCQGPNLPGWAKDFSSGCIYGEGQSIWILLQDTVDPKGKFSNMVKKKMLPADYDIFKADTSDGILCFFYGVGGSKEIWKNNLFSLMNKNILSNLLPWQKRIDMVILPNSSPLNTGGLDFVLSNKPSLPVLTPTNFPPMPWANYMFEMPGKYMKLTDRISCLSLPIKGFEEIEGNEELELIIRTGDGIAVLSGEGKAGFSEIIREAEKNTGKKIYYFLGGTGLLVGVKNKKIFEELSAIKKHNPHIKIYVNHSTSAMAMEMLHSVFGMNFRVVYPGERIKLTPPAGKD
ncbi:MAG: hypothetical protein J7M18_00385, partial [Candidatus Eremiobacteraeota bacterium]|nr:hypothetical protein [Candidatus Eremiobacteraeota bacterium]